MKNLKVILLLFTSFVFFSATANEKSIQWQQMELEKNLNFLFSDYLSRYIDSSKHYVHLTFSTKEQSFTLPSHDIKFKNKKQKFIDKEVPESLSADLIALEKVGILAPSFNPENSNELNLKLFQYKNKLERDLIQKTNVFEFIEKITVNVAIDESINDDVFNGVKEYLGKIVPTIGKIEFEISPYRVKFSKKTLTKELSLQEKILEKVLANGSSIGLVIAAFIASLTALLLFSKYKKLKELMLAASSENGGSSSEAKEQSSISIDNKELVDSEFRPGSDQLNDALVNTVNGVERFVLYLEKSPLQAMNLVKKWLNLGVPSSRNAILLLSERLTVDELTLIFSDLNENERELFASFSAKKVSAKDKKSADLYISQQIIEDILYLTQNVNKSLQQMLVELTPSKAVKLARNDKELGAVLLNLMGVDFVSEMLKELSGDDFSEISRIGLTLKNETLEASLTRLEAKLNEIQESAEVNSFSKRIVELLRQLNVNQENEMINLLIENKHFDALRDFATTTLPACLVFEIPDNALKTALFSIPLEKKIEFFISLEDELRSTVLNKISQEGTKGRDILEHEMDLILKDEAKTSDIKLMKEKHFQEVVKAVRSYIEKLDQSQEFLDSMADFWLIPLTKDGKESNSQVKEAITEAA